MRKSKPRTEREEQPVNARANPYRSLVWGCLISSVLWVALVIAWIMIF